MCSTGHQLECIYLAVVVVEMKDTAESSNVKTSGFSLRDAITWSLLARSAD